MNNKIVPLFVLMAALLSACGGSDVDGRKVDPVAKDTPTDDDTLVEEGDLTNVSFLPLMILELYNDWSGNGGDNLLASYSKDNRIIHYTINPVNASTLAPVTDAKMSDFTLKEDGIPLNPKVSFPMLQKVLGNQVKLKTAIIVNTSSAMDVVNKIALIDEIKDFVARAKSSNVNYIANQQFSVWGYDGAIRIFTTGFQADIDSELDSLLVSWQNDELGAAGSPFSNGANHTYDAIGAAIGGFSGTGPYSHSLDFRDANDLDDYVTPDYINLSNIVLFSAGYSSTNWFNEEYVIKALESQSTIIYDPNIAPSGGSSATSNLGKALTYVIPDGESADSVIAAKSDTIIRNTISAGAYDFASEIVSAQIRAIDKRTALDNQHVVRWASAIRSGTGHSRELTTRTPDDKYGYTISTDKVTVTSTEAMPTPQVEITGSNNEYLASNDASNPSPNIYNSAKAFANQITRFYPAVRWTNQTFNASDYTWASTPADAFTQNSDGSVTIKTSMGYPIVLTLTNNNVQHEGGIISSTFTLTVEEEF